MSTVYVIHFAHGDKRAVATLDDSGNLRECKETKTRITMHLPNKSYECDVIVERHVLRFGSYELASAVLMALTCNNAPLPAGWSHLTIVEIDVASEME